MSDYLGTVIIGSSAILTSVADQEILPVGVDAYDFELMNDQICTISINGGDLISLRASQGISLKVVNSAKIHENGITFNWIGVRQ